MYLDNYDGDTVKVILDQGFSDTKQVDIRLLGVYAPELSQPGGKEVRDFVTEWFMKNGHEIAKWKFVVTTARMKVADREQKTLDRYVATITNLDGTANLNLEVMAFVMANGYLGGVGSNG